MASGGGLDGEFRVGEWAVRPSLNRIERGRELRHLEPKVMDVLRFLAAHAGEVLTRERILREVWPDAFVGDEALTRAVVELRRALDDDARAPHYVQTIAKRGYRLSAEVAFPEPRDALTDSATPRKPETPEPPSPPRTAGER